MIYFFIICMFAFLSWSVTIRVELQVWHVLSYIFHSMRW